MNRCFSTGCSRQLAVGLEAQAQAFERDCEIKLRSPAEFMPRPLVDIHAIDTGIHPPATLRIYLLIRRDSVAQDRGRIAA
ncbi:MAG: hypothetical protein ACI841_000937 [Planctomycetota bacterium]|jgi:hypothetical protein